MATQTLALLRQSMEGSGAVRPFEVEPPKMALTPSWLRFYQAADGIPPTSSRVIGDRFDQPSDDPACPIDALMGERGVAKMLDLGHFCEAGARE